MSILVTGATGFVGLNFIASLTRQGIPASDIRCLVRNPDKAALLEPFGLSPTDPEIIHGDLLQPETYRHALKDITTVFHIAALVGLKNGSQFYEINTEGTQALLTALKESPRLERLVYVSSISAIDRPLDAPQPLPLLTEAEPARPNTDYGKSKRQGEEVIMASGILYTILRPSYIYGPYPRRGSSIDRVIYDIRDQAPYTRFPFPGKASEIYVEDLAEAMWHVSQHPQAKNEEFFVSNPEPVAIAEFFERLAQTMKIPYQPHNLSPERLARMYRRIRRERPQDPVPRILYENAFACSAEKLKRMTGYQPRLGLSEGLEKTLHWYRIHEGFNSAS